MRRWWWWWWKIMRCWSLLLSTHHHTYTFTSDDVQSIRFYIPSISIPLLTSFLPSLCRRHLRFLCSFPFHQQFYTQNYFLQQNIILWFVWHLLNMAYESHYVLWRFTYRKNNIPIFIAFCWPKNKCYHSILSFFSSK